MTVADDLLKGNCGSVYDDRGLISHSDLEGSPLVDSLTIGIICFSLFFYYYN